MIKSTVPVEMLTTNQVSERYNIPVPTLRWWRHKRIGPRSFRMGTRKVMYRKDDVDDWLARQYEADEPTTGQSA